MTFKLFGTKIYVSFLFAAVISLMLATDKTGLVIPTLFAVLLHECGHLLAMWAADCQPKEIRLVPASVEIIRGFSKKPSGELLISLSGPLANLVAAGALFANFSLTKNELSLHFSALNLVMGGFNLLPVSGLDGGNILEALLSRITDFWKAERAVKIITALFAVLSFFYGVFLSLRGNINISIFIVALYFLVCIFIKK